jgi:hypothetical protein
VRGAARWCPARSLINWASCTPADRIDQQNVRTEFVQRLRVLMLRILVLALKGHNNSAQGIALGSRIRTILKPCRGGTIGEPRAMLRSLAEILTHVVRTACFALVGRYPLLLT